MKAIKQIMKKDHVPYRVPKRVQDVIPIKCMWSDGIFLVGTRYSKTFKFTDINYMVASQEAQKKLFLAYAALINSLDCGATTKITLNNRHLNRKNFADTVLMKLKNDYLDYYRMEYNDVIMSKATGGNGIIQEKYVTVSVCKKNIEDARAYFARVGAELTARFAALGAKVTEMDATEKLRVLHDFYRSGEEVYFRFDAQDMMRKGHDFRDYICPDSVEKHSDYLMLGGKYARVIYLKDYASFISDQLVTKLTDQSRSMMLSIDIIPVATDEAVREVERKMLGVETNITNWQRRQNANNNFSAIVPYDMEQQRRETKEYMTDLTSRDQRMMLSVLTIVHLADTKAELDADTDALLKVAADQKLVFLRAQQTGQIVRGFFPRRRQIKVFAMPQHRQQVRLNFVGLELADAAQIKPLRHGIRRDDGVQHHTLAQQGFLRFIEQSELDQIADAVQIKERAEKGELVEISEIAKAYQSAVAHPVSNGQIYRVLHRHGWRKVMPRSRHPQKASEEEIAASKKLKPL